MLFFNGVLLGLDDIFSAQYLIIIGGMLLGNAHNGIIIGIADFYRAVYEQRDRYRYHLAAGASQMEALTPYFFAMVSKRPSTPPSPAWLPWVSSSCPA